MTAKSSEVKSNTKVKGMVTLLHCSKQFWEAPKYEWEVRVRLHL